MTLSEKIIAGVCWSILVLLLNFGIARYEFPALLGVYTLAFILYALIIKRVQAQDVSFFIFVAVLVRAVVVFSSPQFSDDIYRFLFDGNLTTHGINPFFSTPREIIPTLPDTTFQFLFSHINSPDYYSVYPPVCQFLFASAARVFPQSVTAQIFLLKFFIFLFEGGVLGIGYQASGIRHQVSSIKQSFFTQPWKGLKPFQGLYETTDNRQSSKNYFYHQLLKGLKPFKNLFTTTNIHQPSTVNHQPATKILWYALNPLVITELCGNGHTEGIMVFFLLGAICFFRKALNNNSGNLFFLSALFLSLSIATKLLPLMLLPFLMRYVTLKQFAKYMGVVVGLSVIFFLPFYSTVLVAHIGNSLGLYFGRFEFNASIFYVLRAFDFWRLGYDNIALITPKLIGATILFIAYLVWRQFKNTNTASNFSGFWKYALATLCFYFLCATTVHPWYAVVPLACTMFTNFRFPMLWTYTIVFTYAGYVQGSSQHTENFWWIAAEYLSVIFFAVWEFISSQSPPTRY